MTAKSQAARRRRGAGRWLAILGLSLLLLALAAFLYELAIAWQTGSYRVIAAGELWYRLHPGSLNLSQAVIQRYIYPPLWDPLIISLLQWPAWSILGAPGAVLLVLFGRGRRAEG